MKGKKTGGRVKGTLNKVSLARSAYQQEELKRKGQKAALEVLRESMNLWESLAARYQPSFKDGEPQNPRYNEAKYKEAISERIKVASILVQYESPKLASTTLRHDAPPEPIRVQVEFV